MPIFLEEFQPCLIQGWGQFLRSGNYSIQFPLQFTNWSGIGIERFFIKRNWSGKGIERFFTEGIGAGIGID